MNLLDLLGPMPRRQPWQVSPLGARATPEELAAGYRRALQPPQQPPAPQPGLFQRFQNGLMPSPDGAVSSGLLSQGDISQARSKGLLGIGSSLLAAAGPRTASERVPLMAAVAQGLSGGQNAYQEALQGAMALRGAGRKAQSEQMELDTAKKRQEILTALPAPGQSEGPDAMLKWIDQAIPAMVKAGLTEDASRLGTMRKALERDKAQTVQTGNLVTTFDPNANGGKGGIWDPVKQAYVPSIERGMTSDAIELKTKGLELAAERLKNGISVAQSGRMDRLATTYDKHVKPMTDRVQPINQALMALDAAKTSPVVSANAIVAFMTAVDPKATQRYQMVNWISTHLSPSMKAKAIRMLDEKTTGLLPPDLLAEMTAHVQRTKQNVISQEERVYKEYIKMHPEMSDQLPRISTAFEPDALAGAAAPAAPSGGKRQWKTADGTVIDLP